MANFELESVGYEGKRTKTLLRSLPYGSVAFLHHEDIDLLAAEALIEKGVKAVINFSTSMTGKYDHNGVQRLLDAQIAVFDYIDVVDRNRVIEGQSLFIKNEQLYFKEGSTYRYGGKLERYTKEKITTLKMIAKQHYSDLFYRFSENSIAFAKRELSEFVKPLNIPKPFQDLRGKEVLIVVRGKDYEADLYALKTLLRKKLTLIAIDGAADRLLMLNMKPDIIFGDMDSVTEKGLTCGATLIAHSYPDGTSPGFERLVALGLPGLSFSMRGTSEDAAIVAAYRSGAKRIYLIGSHTSMNEFLEKGRSGMGSSLLVRMEAGERIVDLKGIHELLLEEESFYTLRASHR